jgi:opacity protein-like surface antigen
LNELQLPFTSTVDAKSSANELGVECQIGMGFALSVSDVWGIHAAVDRDVLLSSPVPQETSPVDVLRVHVSEDYEMSAQRLSLLKYVDLGYVSPYLRVGVEHVKATHRVSVPIDVGAFTVEERKAKNSPYVGVGVLLFPSSPIGLRCEYQLESTSRHRIATVMIGLYGHFSF